MMWEEREARRERAVEVEVEAMEEEAADGEDGEEEVREREEDGEEEEERGDMMYWKVGDVSHHLIPSSHCCLRSPAPIK